MKLVDRKFLSQLQQEIIWEVALSWISWVITHYTKLIWPNLHCYEQTSNGLKYAIAFCLTCPILIPPIHLTLLIITPRL